MMGKWVGAWVGAGLVLFVVLWLREWHNDAIERKTFPPMYSVQKDGQYAVTEPFWVKHPTDGFLMKNPKFTDDGTFLNDDGMEAKHRWLALQGIKGG